eukprot:1140688-Pelagomonas_calceolata.AAC.3
MTATISARPCPPARNFEHEGWTRFVRGEALALFKSRHVSMNCIGIVMVANTVLPVPGVLGERCFLVRAGFWIIVAMVGTCTGSNFITEMWISSDEIGIGVIYHVFSPEYLGHESSSGLCVENG